jgi:gamma-glutamylcyclotransferase (GGCT)/AIG2-like uncharacterized protein YtfP
MTPEDDASALFVYGTLLDPGLRERLLGRQVAATPGRLHGYERRRNRHHYVVRSSDAETPGLLLEGLEARDFEVLDRYEDVPRTYVRERVEVVDEGGTSRRCWLYLPTTQLLGDRG